MESEGGTASIHELSQEILKKEDSMAQTQSLNNLDRVNQHNNEFTNASKIFVGGLPADLTKDELKAYFEKFGSIEDVVVMSDKETNRPRRFGFVTFDSPDTANNVLKNRYYELKNKRVEVKKAVSKERMTRNLGNYYNTYNAMYNGVAFPYTTAAPYGNYGGYYYGTNSYGYGAYSGFRYEGPPYFYYPYQYPNPSYYDNTYFYQNPYYYADTYSYQSPYYYRNNPKHSYKYRNRTPVVIKNSSRVNNGDGDHHDVRKNVNLNSEVNGEEVTVVRDVLENGGGNHAEISDGSSLGCNHEGEGEGEGDGEGEGGGGEGEGCGGGEGGGGGGDGCCVKGIEALSLCSDGSGEQTGATDGQSSSCTIDS